MTTDYQVLLAQVMDANPDLCWAGWRIPDKGQYKFEQMRAEMRGYVQEFQLAYDWCAQLERRKSPPAHGGYSYGLKHTCENSVDRYIRNGVLIAAMLAHGFEYKMHDQTPNCWFFVSSRSVKAAARERV